MSSKKLLAGNFLYLMGAELARAVLQFFFVKHISTSLGTEQYGIYIAVFNIINLSMIIVNSGLEVYGIREVSKFPEKTTKIVGDILTLRIFLYILTLIGLFAYINLAIESEIRELYYISTIKLLGEAILLSWLFQAKEFVKPVAIRQVVLHLLIFILFKIYISGPGDLRSGVWIFSISSPISSFFLLAYYLKKYSIKIDLNLKDLKKIILQSLPLGINLFMIIIYTRSDIEVLKFMADDPDYAVGIYGAINALVVISAMPTNIFQQILFPRLSRAVDTNERISNYNFFYNISLFTGISFTIIFFTFSKELILLQYDAEYLDGELLLKILSLKIFLIYIAVSSSSPLLAWGKQKTVMYITIGSAILNIIGNLIFVPKYGIYGAAYTTIFSEIFVSVFLGIALSRFIKHYNYVLILKYLIFGFFFGAISFFSYEYSNTLLIPIFVTLIMIFLLFVTCSTFKLKELKELYKK